MVLPWWSNCIAPIAVQTTIVNPTVLSRVGRDEDQCDVISSDCRLCTFKVCILKEPRDACVIRLCTSASLNCFQRLRKRQPEPEPERGTRRDSQK